jgi:hypothetical protein
VRLPAEGGRIGISKEQGVRVRGKSQEGEGQQRERLEGKATREAQDDATRGKWQEDEKE